MRNVFSYVVRYLLVFSAVCVGVMVSTWIVPVRAELMAEITQLGAGFMAVTMVNFAITALVLFLFLSFSRMRGWRLALGLFAIFWGVLYVMSQIESLIFNEALTSMSTRDIIENVLRGLVSTVLSVPAAVLLTGKFKRGSDVEGTTGHVAVVDYAWKLPVAGVIFVLVYWLFGYFVAWQFPAVRLYYSNTVELVPFFPYTAAMLSNSPWFVLVQFGRGLLWGLLAVLSALILGKGKAVSAVCVGAVFALFGLQLMVPNPMMPDVIRIPHLIETASSMLLYGVFLGWFLTPRRNAEAISSQQPAIS